MGCSAVRRGHSTETSSEVAFGELELSARGDHYSSSLWAPTSEGNNAPLSGASRKGRKVAGRSLGSALVEEKRVGGPSHRDL